jgi:cation diffusion facilitator family transporter
MSSYSGDHVHLPDEHEAHDHNAGHGHTHGAVDPSLFRSERGIWAVKWSLVALAITAIFQLFIVAATGSVALLADTIHNFGDALTAIPLWIAFRLGQRPSTKHYTYGLGRVEDLAGLFILLAILVSAILAGREAVLRFLNPQPIEYLWAVMLAALIGFAGNEAVAYFRIKVGKEIGSQALIADGYHARTDGLSSLAVLAGAIGVALGFPLADPLAAVVITIAILKILWDSAGPIFNRLLDGIDPQVVDEIAHAASHVAGVQAVSEVRVRWLGHRMLTELNIAVDPELSVTEGHELARQVHHELLHELNYLWAATIHVDPSHALGSRHHGYLEHLHDDLPVHSHYP